MESHLRGSRNPQPDQFDLHAVVSPGNASAFAGTPVHTLFAQSRRVHSSGQRVPRICSDGRDSHGGDVCLHCRLAVCLHQPFRGRSGTLRLDFWHERNGHNYRFADQWRPAKEIPLGIHFAYRRVLHLRIWDWPVRRVAPQPFGDCLYGSPLPLHHHDRLYDSQHKRRSAGASRATRRHSFFPGGNHAVVHRLLGLILSEHAPQRNLRTHDGNDSRQWTIGLPNLPNWRPEAEARVPRRSQGIRRRFERLKGNNQVLRLLSQGIVEKPSSPLSSQSHLNFPPNSLLSTSSSTARVERASCSAWNPSTPHEYQNRSMPAPLI